jgi:glycosyltransferase involved in cell wall biosynthesis
MKIVDITFVGPLLDNSGVAEQNRNIVLALMDAGIRVRAREIPFWSNFKADLNKDVRDKLMHALTRGDIGPSVAIYAYPPDRNNMMGGIPRFDNIIKSVSYTVFETDKCPISWKEVLNSGFFEENWVPTGFQFMAFESCGIKNTKIVNFGLDVERFNLGVKPMSIDGRKKFAFATAMDWSVRKNPENTLKAYFEEFKDEEDVCFILKAYTGLGDENSKNMIRSRIKLTKEQTNSKASLILITDFFHADLMPSFHKAADVWVNLSLGEGWDFGTHQSMACGVPAVVSESSSHLTYCNKDNSYLVQSSKTPINAPEFIARNPNFIGGHSWWLPELSHSKRMMRKAFDDWKSGELVKKSALARSSACDFNAAKCAYKIIYETAKFV